MAAGPARRVEEPPDEELAGGDGQAVEVPAGHDDRHGLVTLAHDLDDAQPVGQGAVSGTPTRQTRIAPAAAPQSVHQ